MDPIELIHKVLEEYVSANWSTTEIVWENVEARKEGEAGGPFLYEGTDPYVEVLIGVDMSEAAEIPVGCKKYYGQIIINVHVPEGEGARGAMSLLGSLNDLLEYKTLANDIRTKEFNRIGNRYQLRQGWVVYTGLWPIEAQFD